MYGCDDTVKDMPSNASQQGESSFHPCSATLDPLDGIRQRIGVKPKLMQLILGNSTLFFTSALIYSFKF